MIIAGRCLPDLFCQTVFFTTRPQHITLLHCQAGTHLMHCVSASKHHLCHNMLTEHCSVTSDAKAIHCNINIVSKSCNGRMVEEWIPCRAMLTGRDRCVSIRLALLSRREGFCFPISFAELCSFKLTQYKVGFEAFSRNILCWEGNVNSRLLQSSALAFPRV